MYPANCGYCKELQAFKGGLVFFTDDNIAVDPKRTVELLRAIIPLKISWVGQVSLHVAQDEELLALMQQSGCRCVLIGFESLDKVTISAMHKGVNSISVSELAPELEENGYDGSKKELGE